MTLAINFNDPETIALIKTQICKGASDSQLALFKHACQRTGLDPFMKQIYGILRQDKNTGTKVLTIQTSIDGFRVIAERTGKYAPGKETVYHYNKEGQLEKATAYVKKMTPDGTWHEIAVTARMDEYKPKSNSTFWEKMPEVMLGKVAEALALRRAFPQDLSGIYIKEEMAQANKADEEAEDADAVVINTPQIENKAAKLAEINDFLKGKNDAFGDENVTEFILAVVAKRNKMPLKKTDATWDSVVEQYMADGNFDEHIGLFIQKHGQKSA